MKVFSFKLLPCCITATHLPSSYIHEFLQFPPFVVLIKIFGIVQVFIFLIFFFFLWSILASCLSGCLL